MPVPIVSASRMPASAPIFRTESARHDRSAPRLVDPPIFVPGFARWLRVMTATVIMGIADSAFVPQPFAALKQRGDVRRMFLLSMLAATARDAAAASIAHDAR